MRGTTTCIISLTDEGARLARRLLALMPTAEHLHRPQDFSTTLQQRFVRGDRLFLICATGIAVRTLAPVLRNKHEDPPVLVADENGRWIIPLLSGHEGGANAWGNELANRLGAQLVYTTAQGYQRPYYSLGIGCDRGCPAELIESLVSDTLARHNIDLDSIDGIASIDLKADEVGLLAFCESRRLPLNHFGALELRSVESKLSERSEIVFREVGCYGVAEAAALLQASASTGNPAELVISKHKNRRATCALARSYRE
ncbi:cobalamin biosynthesis protein [Aestuariirhabdus litorea]|uniref:Cobalamin biosynthesis protein CbiG n=1 Tax=Aestuariirhabdus litorea TaxID=2528527 RepID=A0A3P3VS39_9GAMM|nr:cobalamin biosynthesis protein [Aestuariirhabdus litorea]RRJ84516.1 cobalamin biosynthesis protein CbiG [Aestuariirhabdus litorea]RWW97741.1 cobalamin biosynthesis protein CbiG [Endozoicomonadaceae bacterium GTF-13]